MSTLQYENVQVSPALADEWLKRNKKNRALSLKQIESFADAMVAGKWNNNGEGIKFSTQGELMDGQHRLHAIVKSRTSQMMTIVRGVEPEAVDTMDSGKKRTVADNFTMNSIPNASLLATVLTFLGRMEHRDKNNTLTTMSSTSWFAVTTPIAKRILGSYPELSDPNDDVLSETSKIYKAVFLSRPAVAAAILHTRRKDPLVSQDFEEGVRAGTNLSAGDPRLALRNFGWTDKANMKHQGIPLQDRHYRAYVKAWKAFRDGQTIKLLKVLPGEKISL